MKVLFSIILKSKNVLIKLLEISLIAAMALLVIDVLWGVGTRYIMGAQDSHTEELARVLLIWVSLLGGAVAYGEKAHLGVDYLVEKMQGVSKTAMSIVVDLCVIGFAVSVLVVGGGNLTAETFRLEQMMMALDIAKGYVYLAVPVSGLFFILFALESILETLTGGQTDKDAVPQDETKGEVGS